MMVWSTPLLKYRETDGIKVNRSHAVSYAMIAYQEAYLKYYYPIEFYTALLSVYADDQERVNAYVQDARSEGYEVLSPSINESEFDFSINEHNQIVYGFNSIKGLKKVAMEGILRERPFEYLPEVFTKLTKRETDKISIKALAFSGALDAFDPDKNRMELFAEAMTYRGDKENYTYEIQTFTLKQQAELEKYYLSIYLTSHPLEGIAQPIDWATVEKEEEAVTTFAMINAIKKIKTKKGDPMAFIQLSCLERDIEAVCFPNLWEKDYQLRKQSPVVSLGSLLQEKMLVKFKGHFEQQGQRTSFILQDIRIPVRQNGDFETHFNEVEETEGEPVEPIEAITAPIMTFDF